MLTVKFKKLADDVKLPVKGSSQAACFDVYAHRIISEATGKVTVKLGFATEIPEGYKGIIVPRSNLTKHHWVMNNSMGVIDSDYRGEWMVVFGPTSLNFGFPYNTGDRVAQIYFEKVQEVEFEEVKELQTSDRGTGGFGSTGLN